MKHRLLTAAAFGTMLYATHARADDAAEHAHVRAAFGKGVTIASPSGDTELQVRGRVQVQSAVETNAPEKDGSRPAPDASFGVRRLRLLFQGHVLKRTFRYYIQLGLATRDMEQDLLVPTRDAYVEWLGARDAIVRAGQMKVPFSRERITSSGSLELVDRSNVNAELSLDRDVGVQVYSKDLFGAGKHLRYYAGVFGGDGRNRTANRAGLLWVARVEALPFGDFDDYVQADLTRASKPRLSFGVATAYNQSTVRAQSVLGQTFSTGTVDYKHATADVAFRWLGVAVEAGVLYRKADQLALGTVVDAHGKSTTEQPRPALGAYLQAGYVMGRGFDVAARYGEVRPMDNRAVHRDREIGGGIGWFLHGHDLKLQADVFRLLREGSEGEVSTDRVRLQTQLWF